MGGVGEQVLRWAQGGLESVGGRPYLHRNAARVAVGRQVVQPGI